MKFKVGDTVLINKRPTKTETSPSWNTKMDKYLGKRLIVSEVLDDRVKCNVDNDEVYWWFHNNWIVGAKGKAKTKPVHFLLKYGLSGIEEFETTKEVNDRIKELVNDINCKRDSMVVYEIKSKKVVKIDTLISMKAA